MGISYEWFDNNTKRWKTEVKDEPFIENRVKAISWQYKGQNRVLAFNIKIPVVSNNIDICLFETDIDGYKKGKISNEPSKIIMLGELKGGVDPAGADEHWKTANSALNRIKTAFAKIEIDIKTSFIAAAIERKMAEEIFQQIQNEELSFAANLTVDKQLVHYCDWVIKL